jgi:hypothetical protein
MVSDAPTRHRRRLTKVLVLYGCVFTYIGLRSHRPTEHVAWFYTAAGIFLFGLSLGVGYAHQWARRTCGIASIVFAVTNPIVLIPGVPRPRAFATSPVTATIVMFLATGVWVLIAIYCLRSSTRQAFAEARQAIVEGRMKPV